MWQFQQNIPMPPHRPSNFDHGDVHRTNGRVFVAHTQAGTVEVLDGVQGTHLTTIPHCAEASGVLVAQEANIVFAAAREDGKILVIDALHFTVQREIVVDPHPNGLAWDPIHQHLLVADVQTNTARLVGLDGTTYALTPLPGRPRWCVFDQDRERFLVNIRDPACVQVLAAQTADPVATWPIDGRGPHGLDLDPRQNRVFVACDGGEFLVLDLRTGQEMERVTLSGAPDAIWYDPHMEQVMVAIGQPGVVDVVDISVMQIIQTISTEEGAHTTAFDPDRQVLYVFLPTTCQTEVFKNQ